MGGRIDRHGAGRGTVEKCGFSVRVRIMPKIEKHDAESTAQLIKEPCCLGPVALTCNLVTLS